MPLPPTVRPAQACHAQHALPAGDRAKSDPARAAARLIAISAEYFGLAAEISRAHRPATRPAQAAAGSGTAATAVLT